MRELTFRDALNEAYKEEMRRDETVITFGEDLALFGGGFQATKGLLEEFGPDRVKDTPVSEVAIVGAAIGSSLVGLRPVAELMFNDFAGVAGDQIINQMAKLRYMTGGQFKLPLVLRMTMGGGLSQAAQHAQCLVGMFMNVPGLKIVCPSNAYDQKGIFKSAVRDDNPVLIFEHLLIYDDKCEVPEEEYLVPLGRADVKKSGKDITIVAISQMVGKSLNVAKEYKEKGVDIEVVDPISLVPLDMDTILTSVRKTGKVIVVYNGSRTNGAGAEISARINEMAFDSLKAPILRVAEKDAPIPFSPILETEVLPQEEDIVEAVEKLINL